MTKAVVNQTYFIVKVKKSDEREREKYLMYDGYDNTYHLVDEVTHASQFNEQVDAERVAHFYKEQAVRQGVGDTFMYSLQKEDVSRTEIALERRDYLEGHDVSVELES